MLKLAGETTIHLCMEATGVYSQHLAIKLLELSGLEVSIVNPARIKAYSEVLFRRSKTDMIDAEVIRCYAESQKPATWQPAPKAKRQLYELVAQMDSVQESLRQWRNRRHAQEYITDLPRTVSEVQRTIERTLEKQLVKLERAIDQLCAENAELAQQITILTSIPGIARKSAVQVMAHGREWLTERSAKALTAYAGLASHHHESGTSVKARPRLDKRGNKRLRKALYMPALVATVHNPIIKKFYQRLCRRGKAKMLALVACMRKLLLIMRSMLIKKNAFNPKFNA